MNIEPMPRVVYIKTESVKVGNWDTSGKDSAVEFAEVLEIGRECYNEHHPNSPKNNTTHCEKCADLPFHYGDKVFVKSWAIDIINHEGEWHKFVHLDSKGILAKIKE